MNVDFVTVQQGVVLHPTFIAALMSMTCQSLKTDAS